MFFTKKKGNVLNGFAKSKTYITHFIRNMVFYYFQGSHMKRVVGVASETCPNKVMTLNNRLMVQFIRKHINLEPNSEIEDYIDNEKDLLVEGFGTNHCVLKEPGRP